MLGVAEPAGEEQGGLPLGPAPPVQCTLGDRARHCKKGGALAPRPATASRTCQWQPSTHLPLSWPRRDRPSASSPVHPQSPQPKQPTLGHTAALGSRQRGRCRGGSSAGLGWRCLAGSQPCQRAGEEDLPPRTARAHGPLRSSPSPGLAPPGEAGTLAPGSVHSLGERAAFLEQWQRLSTPSLLQCQRASMPDRHDEAYQMLR